MFVLWRIVCCWITISFLRLLGMHKEMLPAYLVEQPPIAKREVSIIPEHRQQGQALVATETRGKRGGEQALLVLRNRLELDKAIVGKLVRERERQTDRQTDRQTV